MLTSRHVDLPPHASSGVSLRGLPEYAAADALERRIRIAGPDLGTGHGAVILTRLIDAAGDAKGKEDEWRGQPQAAVALGASLIAS